MCSHGPLTRYAKLLLSMRRESREHFPATDFKGNRKLAIPACLTARARRMCRDRSRHSRCKRNPQFCAPGKMSINRYTCISTRMKIRPYCLHLTKSIGSWVVSSDAVDLRKMKPLYYLIFLFVSRQPQRVSGFEFWGFSFCQLVKTWTVGDYRGLNAPEIHCIPVVIYW